MSECRYSQQPFPLAQQHYSEVFPAAGVPQEGSLLETALNSPVLAQFSVSRAQRIRVVDPASD